MAWTTPKTWTVGEVLTAANLNTHLRDNLSFLKDTPATSLPASPSEGQRATVLTADNELSGYFANEFVYLPSVDATRPWHWVGGPGFSRYFGQIYSTAANGVWQNKGTVFVAPVTGYYDLDLSWTESNTYGESNGSLSLGLDTGTRFSEQTLYDTASARVYTIHNRYRYSLTKGDTVVLWMLQWDAGNPAQAYNLRVEAFPLRGSA